MTSEIFLPAEPGCIEHSTEIAGFLVSECFLRQIKSKGNEKPFNIAGIRCMSIWPSLTAYIDHEILYVQVLYTELASSVCTV